MLSAVVSSDFPTSTFLATVRVADDAGINDEKGIYRNQSGRNYCRGGTTIANRHPGWPEASPDTSIPTATLRSDFPGSDAAVPGEKLRGGQLLLQKQPSPFVNACTLFP
jgi:hypothetical protein